MKYEVAFISQSGNTEKLAHGIADCLPHRDTYFTNLASEEITGMADIYILGFGMKKEAIPLKIMEVLEELEGKTVLFFVTASIKPTEEHIREIKRRLEPFMPTVCDYKGLYLCPGQVSDATLEKLKAILENDPDNAQAKEAYNVCSKTIGRPNREDIDDACDFIKEKLNIN